MIGVYKITNIINGKVYIGESMNIEERWNEHEKELKCGNHHSYKLQKDYNTYGKDNFKFEVLEEIDKDLKPIIQKCLLYILEDKYIKQYNSIDDGYNVENTLELVLKGEKQIFNTLDPNKNFVSILESVIKNIKKNKGIYIPTRNSLKENVKPKLDISQLSNENYINLLYNEENKNITKNICNNYIFNEEFIRLSNVLKDIGFNTTDTFLLLRHMGILNNKNKCLINDSRMFKFEKKILNNNKNKFPITNFITSISKEGFEFLLNKILEHAKINNINIFTWKFIQENLIMD